MTQSHKGLLAFSYSQWLLLAFSWSKLLLSRDSYAASSSAALFQCDCVSLKSLPKSCIQSSRIVYQNIRFFSLWEWNEKCVCVCIYTHIFCCESLGFKGLQPSFFFEEILGSSYSNFFNPSLPPNLQAVLALLFSSACQRHHTFPWKVSATLSDFVFMLHK